MSGRREGLTNELQTVSDNAEGVGTELITLEHERIGDPRGPLGTTRTTEEEVKFLGLAQLFNGCAAHVFTLVETVVGTTDCTLL